MRRLGLLAVLATLAAVAACDRLAPKARPAATPATAPSSTELETAFRTAFGSPSPAMRIVRRGENDVTLRYRPARLIDLGRDTLSLVSEGRTDGCHGCFGALAIHYLERQGRGFRTKGAWPEIVDGSSYGESPAWSLRNDLFPAPGIEARGGGTWQGCTVRYGDYIELTRDGPKPRARRILLAFDDEGVAVSMATAVEATVRPDVRGRSFVVDYTGDRALSVVYRLVGGIYLPEGRQEELPAC